MILFSTTFLQITRLSAEFKEPKDDASKRKQSALEEIMAQEKKRKKEEDSKIKKERCWLRPKIVVKIVTKSLANQQFFSYRMHASHVISVS